MKKLVLITLLITMFCSGFHAENYRERYADVIFHYQKNASDSMRLKAALYLIDNMNGHRSPEGKEFDRYLDKLRQMRPRSNMGELERAWEECVKDENAIKMLPDSSIITSQYLITNIDEAFDAWEKAPWKDDISFSLFCEYILPYRVHNEHLSEEWRKKLRNLYNGILSGVRDMNEAFVLIRQEVLKRVKKFSSFSPYVLDVMSYEHLQRATCSERCILMASVMRAFAIPAAVDMVPLWADYSASGHSWVSLVHSNGDTYTVYENDTLARKHNEIDASNLSMDFDGKQPPNFKYQIKTKKSVSKIYRVGYGMKKERKRCLYPSFWDVSDRYNLKGRLEVTIPKDTAVYLCTYLTGHNWKAVDMVFSHNGRAIFKNIGTNIVYLPMKQDVTGMKAISNPILLDTDGNTHVISFNKCDTMTISIDRKYPLCSYMPVQWMKLVHGSFEASNDSLFEKNVTLATIETMPYGDTSIKTTGASKYRYVRFRCPKEEIALLSELAFYDLNGNMLKGKDISFAVDVKTIAYLYDNDVETKVKASKPGYWVGLDLGDSIDVSEIKFTPVSDGNNIQNGHSYELWGFGHEWELLGRCHAKSRESLSFHGVPKGMLLLLKDRTEGHEERIFTYKDGQQVWW